MSRPLLLAILLGLGATGCASKRAIIGQVIDRNGQPMDRVIISLDPGNVELITDSTGSFRIDYLRDAEGERTRLDRKTDYVLEVFRTGYHVGKSSFFFKKGELVLEPITLKEDTIILRASEDDIDPARFPDRTHSSGSNYEGE